MLEHQSNDSSAIQLATFEITSSGCIAAVFSHTGRPQQQERVSRKMRDGGGLTGGVKVLPPTGILKDPKTDSLDPKTNMVRTLALRTARRRVNPKPKLNNKNTKSEGGNGKPLDHTMNPTQYAVEVF